MTIHAPKIGVFMGFYPQMGSSMNEIPKKHILGRKHVVWRIDRQNRSTCARSARAEEYSKKGVPKKPQQVFFHVFAQTTHVVAAPHGLACVVIPTTWLYIPSFIEIRSGVSEPRGGSKFALSHYFGY